MRKWLGINAKFGGTSAFILGVVFFAICLGAYVYASQARHAENPDDRVMPTISKVWDAFLRYGFKSAEDGGELDRRTGQHLLWLDTIASAKRFGIALAIISFGGIFIGLYMGVFPFVDNLLNRFVTFFDKVPALCLLPLVFIFFGIEENTKIILIVIGVMPTIILDTYNQAKSVQKEQVIKGHSLGASDQEISAWIVLGQIFPKSLDAIRLSLKAMIVLLIAAETLAASQGIGYRIFVVRRYMAMDVSLAYVLWISLLMFLMDLGIRLWIRWRYRWLNK